MAPERTPVELERVLRSFNGELANGAAVDALTRQEFERQARFLVHVIESLPHPFYVIDAQDYTILLANSAAQFGDLSLRPTCHALTHASPEPCGGDEHACPLEIVKRTRSAAVVEHIHYDCDGRPRSIEVHAHPILDELGEVAMMIEYCFDITDRKIAERERARLEERLHQSTKLEALGTLAGGVAHDMNNLLAVVLGGASLLQLPTLTQAKRDHVIQQITQAAERGAALTNNLLGFARRSPQVHERLDLGRIATAAVELLAPIIPKDVSITSSIEPDLPAFDGDAGQIGQVVMNLCLNAVQATPGGGQVQVVVCVRIVPGEPVPGLAGVSPGRYLELRVIDHGVGMTPEQTERALEPFFTTKPSGQGTGLGLSLAYGTVATHHGHLLLESDLGQGTTATVLLPTIDPRQPSAAPPRARLTSARARRKVLLVDDEPLVLEVTSDLLASLGCDVLVADDGVNALRLYREYLGEIDLVILDILMPVMDGGECFERLRALDAQARVLLCSGYAGAELIDHLLADGAVGILRKPFRLDQLQRALDAALA